MTSRVFFFILEQDKELFTGLSTRLRRVLPDYIKRCSKFHKDNNQYVVNIALKSIISKEDFDIITEEIFEHFGKKISVYYKNNDEKYTYSYIVDKSNKYTFTND